jgi:hypothetical protein
MTVAEALELLGLSEVGTADEIRRAYLKGVRRCKPEKDPEGFLRLREAYELVSRFVCSTKPTAGASSGADFGDVIRARLVFEPAPEEARPATPGDSNPEATDDTDDEVGRRLTHLDTLDEVHHHFARLNLIRDTIRDFPEDSRARHALVDALASDHAWDPLGEALRDAVDAGHSQFFELLERQFPELLRAEEIDRLDRSPDAAQRAHAAAARVLTGDMEGGVNAIDRLLGDRSLDDMGGLTRAHVVLCILTLVETGSLDLARHYFEQLSRWRMGEAWDSHVAAIGEIAAAELLILPDDFPAALRSAIAKAARRGQLVSASDELLEYSDHHHRAANQAAKILVKFTPLLGQTYENLLSSKPADGSDGGGSGVGGRELISRIVPVFVILLAINALRLCEDSSRYTPTSDQLQRLEMLSESERSIVDIVCGSTSLDPEDPMCVAIADTRAALDAGDCDGAREAYQRVREIANEPFHLSTSRIQPMTKKTLWGKLEVAVVSACPEPTDAASGTPP